MQLFAYINTCTYCTRTHTHAFAHTNILIQSKNVFGRKNPSINQSTIKFNDLCPPDAEVPQIVAQFDNLQLQAKLLQRLFDFLEWTVQYEDLQSQWSDWVKLNLKLLPFPLVFCSQKGIISLVTIGARWKQSEMSTKLSFEIFRRESLEIQVSNICAVASGKSKLNWKAEFSNASTTT